MRAVAITVTPSTQKLEITSGRLVWGDMHALTITNADGNYPTGRTWALTLKRRDRYSADALTVVTALSISSASATCTLNLNIDALKTLLDAGNSPEGTCVLELCDQTDTTYGRANVTVRNRARRPSDTVPADSDPAAEADGTIWVVKTGTWIKDLLVTQAATAPATTYPGKLWLDTSA